MTVDKIFSAIDNEISRLQQARKLLASDRAQSHDAKPVARKRRRKMSAASRAKIAAAEKSAWAARMKASA